MCQQLRLFTILHIQPYLISINRKPGKEAINLPQENFPPAGVEVEAGGLRCTRPGSHEVLAGKMGGRKVGAHDKSSSNKLQEAIDNVTLLL